MPGLRTPDRSARRRALRRISVPEDAGPILRARCWLSDAIMNLGIWLLGADAMRDALDEKAELVGRDPADHGETRT